MPKTSNSKQDLYQYSVHCEADGKIILNQVEFDFKSNSNLFIIGPGNSGKSTLLHFLAGTNNPDLEIVSSFSKNMPIDEVALCSQSTIYPQTPFSEILEYHGDPELIIDEFWVNSEVYSDLISSLHLPSQDCPKWVKRFYIITLFIIENMHKQYWLLDEPEQGLGEKMNALAEKLKEYKQQKTIIVVTHNVEFTMLIADRILYLYYGNLRANMDSEDFFKSDNINIKNLIKYGC